MHYQSYKHAYLLLGGNLGDRVAYLKQARHLIQIRCGEVVNSSNYYETAAWGKTDQPHFINQAVIISTMLMPEQLLKELLEIELLIGRTRKEKNGPRTIDIDILFVDDNIINSKELSVPHPEIANRRFVLTPLAAIAPDFMHPVLKQTMKNLLVRCKDPLPVNEWKG